MPNYNHIKYIRDNVRYIQDPILIVGSKEYEFDQYNFFTELKSMDFKTIIGIDIQIGEGVDIQADICNISKEIYNKYVGYFNTVVCMQTLYAVQNPFIASQNIEKLMSTNGVLLFSDVFSHRIHRIPKDYWRFTYDAHKILFTNLKFDDKKAKIGITRENKLININFPHPELNKYKQQEDESFIGYIIRKIHRKLFTVGLLNLPRLLPELSIFSIAFKK